MAKLVMGMIPLIIIGIDQWVKHGVRCLSNGVPFFRVSGVLELVPSLNTGAAFSLLRGHNVILILLSFILLIFLCVYVKKTFRLTKCARVSCLCLLAGGVDNLIDRLLYAGVTDYIRLLFIDFPVFNLADIVITCSVFILILLILTNRLEETSGERHG